MGSKKRDQITMTTSLCWSTTKSKQVSRRKSSRVYSHIMWCFDRSAQLLVLAEVEVLCEELPVSTDRHYVQSLSILTVLTNKVKEKQYKVTFELWASRWWFCWWWKYFSNEKWWNLFPLSPRVFKIQVLIEKVFVLNGQPSRGCPKRIARAEMFLKIEG
jgi:hypothetical protein